MFATKAWAGQNKIVCPGAGNCAFSASSGLRKGQEAEGANAAADGGDCERNVLPLSANQVGGSMGGEAHFAKPCLWCPLPGTAAVLAGDF